MRLRAVSSRIWAWKKSKPKTAFPHSYFAKAGKYPMTESSALWFRKNHPLSSQDHDFAIHAFGCLPANPVFSLRSDSGLGRSRSRRFVYF